eukprot:9500662-Lingulodinium_polyedra.AAC.1
MFKEQLMECWEVMDPPEEEAHGAEEPKAAEAQRQSLPALEDGVAGQAPGTAPGTPKAEPREGAAAPPAVQHSPAMPSNPDSATLTASIPE